ncbi:hypothetical protein FB446DRAFT_419612 [Lentinula raphanica]|nr:hypothetical protein FB446DRAFT_419612 [Lentinula raphanica]
MARYGSTIRLRITAKIFFSLQKSLSHTPDMQPCPFQSLLAIFSHWLFNSIKVVSSSSPRLARLSLQPLHTSSFHQPFHEPPRPHPVPQGSYSLFHVQRRTSVVVISARNATKSRNSPCPCGSCAGIILNYPRHLLGLSAIPTCAKLRFLDWIQ